MLQRGMKIFTVHVKPDASQPYEKPVFVREGFSVYAFLFTFLWALYHRLWWPAIVMVGLNMLFATIMEQHMMTPISVLILQLAAQVIIGFHANDWLRSALDKQGYILADITAGDTTLRAEQRYFERYLSAA